jgi:hypothetical protein
MERKGLDGLPTIIADTESLRQQLQELHGPDTRLDEERIETTHRLPADKRTRGIDCSCAICPTFQRPGHSDDDANRQPQRRKVEVPCVSP